MADHSVAATLSGDAALSSDLTGSVPVGASLSGDAALSSDLTGSVPVGASLSGDADLNGKLDQDFVISSVISGDADLTATDSTAVPVEASLSGDAALAASLQQDSVISSNLSGDADLNGKLDQDSVISSNLSGDAVLTATDSTTVPTEASLSGDADLNGKLDQDFVVSSNLSGDAALSGDLDQDFVISSNLSGDAVLTATDSTAVPVEASLSGDATLSATASVPRYSIQSIVFSGTDEYVKMGNVLGFSSSDPFSICYWFKSGSSSSSGYVVTKAVAGVTGYGIYHNSTGREELRLMDGPGDETRSVSSIVINDLKWHHVVVTYDGGKRFAGIHHYIDGVLDLAPTTSYNNLSGTLLNSAEFNISGRSNGSAVLTAGISLDEVLIWDKVLSAAEAAEVYNGGRPADLNLHSAVVNLVGWWRMGEGSSFPTIPDASVSGYDGTMVNMESTDITSDTPWTHSIEAAFSGDSALTGDFDQDFVVSSGLSGDAVLTALLRQDFVISSGLSGDADLTAFVDRIPVVFSRRSLILDGTNEYLTMGDVLDKNKVDPFSISCWFKTSLTSIQYLVSKFDATPRGWGLRTNNGTLEMLLFNSGGIQVDVKTTAATFADGLWHHVVATIDGSGLASGVKLHVDNVNKPLTVVVDTLGIYDFNNLGSLNVGTRTNGAAHLLTGSVDDVSIWSIVLDAQAVSEVYNDGYPGDLTKHPQVANMVGWWLMGDGDTYPAILDHVIPKQLFPVMSDLGPSSHDGTATNMELADVQADVPGAYAAVFGGSTEYVRVPHNVAFSFEYNQPFSISAWIRADPSYASNRFFVTKTNTTRGWWLGTYSSGALWFQIAYDGSNYVRAAASINVCDGAWHYIVGTYDGSGTAAGMQVYVDGQLATTSQAGNPLALTIATTSDVNFSGANNTNWRGGQKDISDVAIWSKTLSASEVSELYNDKRPVDHTIVASNLIGWWRIGTRFSTVSNGIIDFSGNGRHGSAISMVSTNFVRRDYGDTLSKSLLFGGTDEYVTMGNVLGFERTDAFSVSLWFKSTVSGVFLSKYSSIFRGFATYVIGTGLIDFALVSDASQRAIIRTTTAWHDGNWHHVAVVSTGTSTVAGMKIYVDGVVQTTTTIDDGLAATIVSTSNLWLGGRDVPGDEFYLVGSLDDVSVWDKALSQAEVTAVYNFGIPTNLSGSSNLVGYWSLGDLESNNHDGIMVNMESADIILDASGELVFYEGTTDLTADGSVFFSVEASLSGDADLTATDSTAVPVEASLSGDAVLTATDSTAVPVEASLSGDADLNGKLDQDFVISSIISGNADLNGKLDQDFVVSSGLSGDAELSALLQQDFVISSGLSGDADLTAYLFKTTFVSSAISGDAALAASLQQDSVISSNLLGDAALIASFQQDFMVSSAISGNGTLTADLLKIVPVSSTISGDADLTALLQQDFMVSSGLSGDAALTALLLQDFAVSSAISGDAILTSLINQDFVVSSDLSGDAELSALLEKIHFVESPLFGESSLEANLTGDFFVDSVLSGDAVLTATDSTTVPILSNLSGDAECSGDLGQNYGIGASLSGGASLVAILDQDSTLLAQLQGSANLQAFLIGDVFVSSALSCSSNLTGILSESSIFAKVGHIISLSRLSPPSHGGS